MGRDVPAMFVGWLLLPLVPPLSAQLPSATFEKAVYNEQTVGNLEEAIRLYRTVISDAEDARSVAAKAQYRLGQCLLKQGKRQEATAAFQHLLDHWPGEAELVARARKLLPGLMLQPAPWKDGERLTMSMKLQGGQPIGVVGLSVKSAQLNDCPMWKVAVRRFIVGGENQGLSRVVMDQESMRPRQTVMESTIFGNSSAEWGDKEIVITRPGEESPQVVEMDEPAFSNDETLYVMRVLPLEVGYKVTLALRVAFTGGNPVGFEISVSKKEEIVTPAGTFDCFRLETNIAQTFWITDTPERYLARFEAEGVVSELSSIDLGGPQRVENSELGFAVTVPEGWISFFSATQNERNSAILHLVAPELGFAMLRVKKKELLNDRVRGSVQDWADSRLKNFRNSFKNVVLSDEGIEDTTLAGMAAVKCKFQYEMSKRPMDAATALAMSDTLAVDIGMFSPTEKTDDNSLAFSQIMSSLTVDE